MNDAWRFEIAMGKKKLSSLKQKLALKGEVLESCDVLFNCIDA